MDDNPWDDPSPDPTVHDDSSAEPAPRLSLEDAEVELDKPAWGADESGAPVERGKVEQEPSATAAADHPSELEAAAGEVDDQAKGVQATEEQGGPSTAEDTAPAASDDAPPRAPASTSSEPNTAQGVHQLMEEDNSAEHPTPDHNIDEPATVPSANAPLPPSSASTPSEPTALSASAPAFVPSFSAASNEGPPMDDFDDPASSFPDEPAPSSSAPPADDFGDFDDDFGEMGAAGEAAGDDFGDFGDAAPLDEAAFEAPSPAQPATPAPPPVASTSYLPPLRLDLSSHPLRRTVAPQLREFCGSAWGGKTASAVSDEQERQVEGIAQVLVTEGSRNLLSTLSSLPPLRPLDWRRSKIRREHLVALGVPVNLDDSADAKPLSSLVLSSPRLGGPSIDRPASAPPHSGPTSSLPFSSRPSTPFADRARSHPSAAPPTLDRKRADELLSLREDDLTLLSVAELRAIRDEMERISVEASGVLTHALLAREKEGQDKEIYNGMIQDLVIAAAKMKTTSSIGAGAGRGAPKRQTSGRWGRGGG
ncbi:hypothetical protein JCM5296_003748 [Sporobolomyces johnsonii]